MKALLFAALLQGQTVDEGTFVVREDTVEVAREAFRLVAGRIGTGGAGWTLASTIRYDRVRPVITVAPILEVCCDTLPFALQYDVAGPREPARILIVGTYRPSDVAAALHPLKPVKQELQVHGDCDELALDFTSDWQLGSLFNPPLHAGNRAEKSGGIRPITRLNAALTAVFRKAPADLSPELRLEDVGDDPGGTPPLRPSAVGYFPAFASTSRAVRMRYSSPSTLTSVPPYLE